MDMPATGSAQEWVESLMSRLPALEACAVLEHRFGVLPLLDAFFEPLGTIGEVASGLRLGSLGLFTPAPEPRWGAAAVEGEPSGGGLLLRGEVRIPGPSSEGSLVLARLAQGEHREHRLAWLDHGAPGVEKRGSRKGGPVLAGAPCWLALEGATVGPGLVSRPVTLAPGTDLYRHLEAYAGVWALAAVICVQNEIRALRRAARTTRHRGTAFSASQQVAMDITEVEIEAELTAAAVRGQLALAPDDPARASDLALAAAAARILSAAAARTRALRDLSGLELDGSEDHPAGALTAFLGGPLMLENELAHALGIRGIRDLPPQETNG